MGARPILVEFCCPNKARASAATMGVGPSKNQKAKIRREISRKYYDAMDWIAQSEDNDKAFSYYTKQQVNIIDKRLGILYYFLIATIVLYIVIYMFIIEEGYLELEQAKGSIATHISGEVFAISSGKPKRRYFSSEEIAFPGLENGNIFIATRYKTSLQKQEKCEDRSISCLTDADCTAGLNGTCTKDGYCSELSWCNQEEKNEVYALDTGLFQMGEEFNPVHQAGSREGVQH